MAGLIRIPGGIASNFESGNGSTIIDLINRGNPRTGHAEITEVEILFTETDKDQPFEILPMGYQTE